MVRAPDKVLTTDVLITFASDFWGLFFPSLLFVIAFEMQGVNSLVFMNSSIVRSFLERFYLSFFIVNNLV